MFSKSLKVDIQNLENTFYSVFISCDTQKNKLKNEKGMNSVLQQRYLYFQAGKLTTDSSDPE